MVSWGFINAECYASMVELSLMLRGLPYLG